MPFAGKPGVNHPHVQTFAIADSKLADNLLTTMSSHDAFEASDANIQNVRDKMENAVGTGAAGYVTPSDGSHPGAPVDENPAPDTFCADTLEELASYMGYDDEQTANLLASVEEWNACCAAGVDSDFGKDAAALFPIDTVPYFYYATDRQPQGNTGMACLCGLITDNDMNVLRVSDKQPIEGLYACGNCLGGRYALTYPTPVAGNTIGSAMTNGYVLGKHLAEM